MPITYPMNENSFDLLINNYMFDLLPEPDFEPVLAEFGRVLKPGGRLVLANMAREGTLVQSILGSCLPFPTRLA